MPKSKKSRSLSAEFDRAASRSHSPTKKKAKSRSKGSDLTKAHKTSSKKATKAANQPQWTPMATLAKCKELLFDRLQCWPDATAFEGPRKRLRDMLHTTITAGDSNSVLLVGPRGCGKSAMVASVLRELTLDAAVQQRGFHCIHLSGLVQTDDALAIKHIANALIRQGAIIESTATTAVAPETTADVQASAAEMARALREALLAGDASSTRSILVVLDEVDLYAHHGQQTLLYTLLDLAQSGTTPLAIVGLTCRLDTVAMLEKRVLSRFSQQQLHLFNDWSLEQYQGVLDTMLTLPETTPPLPSDFVSTWNQKAQDMLANPSVLAQVQALYEINRADLRPLQQLAWAVIAQATVAEPFVRSDHVFDVTVSQSADAKVLLLLSASALELCLVIAGHQLTRRGATSFNFEQLYDCYRKFALGMQRDAFDLYQQPVALKAFEHLCAMELLRPADARAYPVTDVYRPMQLMITTPQLLEVLDKCATLSTRVKSWAKSGGL